MVFAKQLAVRVSSLLIASALAGCATPGNTPPRAAAASKPAPGVMGRIGALPPQTLAEGTCGLFLWARTAERSMVLYATDTPASARLMIDGQQVDLPRTVAEGTLVFGHHTAQEFAQGPLRVKVSIRPQPNSGITGGAVVRRGMVNFSDGTGPDLVLPVAGLIACTAG